MEPPFTSDFFRRLQQLKIHTRRSFLGSRQGIHRSTRKGQGLEFSDYRPYAPGDDFRHIDWGVYGRTDRMYVRQFREEQDLQVNVLIDTSPSMEFPEKGESKIDLAKNIALALGFVALTDGDSVTFSLLGQEVSPKYLGPQATRRAFRYLKKFSSSANFDFKTAVGAAIAKQNSPGKCFVISDFLFNTDEFIDGINLLKYRNFDISIIQILSPLELKLEDSLETLAIDSESGKEQRLVVNSETQLAYARLLAQHIEEIETYCSKSGISFLTISSEEELADLILTRFPRQGMLS